MRIKNGRLDEEVSSCGFPTMNTWKGNPLNASEASFNFFARKKTMRRVNTGPPMRPPWFKVF